MFPLRDTIPSRRAPLVLWLVGGVLWFTAVSEQRGAVGLAAAAVGAIAAHFALPPLLDLPKLAVSDYKGASYARRFPDSERVYQHYSPFGYLEVYSSSYLHFAPGLSDNAAFTLPKMPTNAYLGMYIDGEGPSGIIRDLPPEQTAYYRFLPMFYPYLIKQAPDTFVVQFVGLHLPFRLGQQGIDFPTFVNSASSGYLFKVGVALAVTPLLYLLHGVIDRYLGEATAEQIVEKVAVAEHADDATVLKE